MARYPLALSLLVSLLAARAWLPAQAAAQPAQQSATDVSAPRLLTSASPAYPQDGDGEAVRVIATLVVNSTGKVTEVDILAVSHTDPRQQTLFARSARGYLRGAQFAPATVGGQAVAGRIRIEVTFTPPAALAELSPPAGAALAAAAPPPFPSPQELAQQSAGPVAEPEPAQGPSTAATPQARGLVAADRDGDYGATANVDVALRPDQPAAASRYRIPLQMLRFVPRRATEAYLTLSPGVVLVNHAGEGHASQAFLRGFDAGEGQDLEVRVDGVPINEPSNAHGHGYADSHFVIPETVLELTMLQGPFDPRQGSFAVAGTAEYRLGVARPGISAQVDLGSFGHRRLLALWAPSGAFPGRFGAVELLEGDGFGPSRAHRRVTAAGQFAGQAGAVRYRLGATAHALRFDSAGVVRADALQTGDALQCPAGQGERFFCTHDPNQDGSASRYQLSGAVDAGGQGFSFHQGAFVALRANRFRENFTGYLLDDRGDLLDEQSHYGVMGARGYIRTERKLWGRAQRFELGYDARHDRGDVRAWRVRRDASIPYEAVFDNAVGLTNIAAYGRLQLELPRLHIMGGLRADAFGYEVTDRNRPQADLSGARLAQQATTAFGTLLQPRLSLRLRLLGDLFLQLAGGVGARASDGTALSQGERAPFARVIASEAGIVFADHPHAQAHGKPQSRGTSVDGRLIGYFTHVDRDLLFDPNAARNVPIGASNRFGVTASLRATMAGHLDTTHSVSWSEAYLPADGKSLGLRSGLRMPFVPRFSARSDTVYRDYLRVVGQRFDWSLALGGTWIGPRPLPLNTLSGHILSLDARVGVQWAMWALSLSLENLLDRRNRMSEFNYPSRFDPTRPASLRSVRHFSAGPPRRLMLTLAARFDVGEPQPNEEDTR